MTTFVDASVIVAMVAGEKEHIARCFAALRTDEKFITSPLATWEAAMAVRRKAELLGQPIPYRPAWEAVDEFCRDWAIGSVAIISDDYRSALIAHADYGKGSPTPNKAKLNMADCFHYAVAKRHEAGMLFTRRDEFHHTDLTPYPD